jgi:hypothetical protein
VQSLLQWKSKKVLCVLRVLCVCSLRYPECNAHAPFVINYFLCILRALAQTISYEVRLAFVLLSFVILGCSYNLGLFLFF